VSADRSRACEAGDKRKRDAPNDGDAQLDQREEKKRKEE